MVKVIASSVRKGNVLDLDGKLCVVMKAENIHPGKGTPVTHLDMRRIADGVKITERYRTTDQVERAYLEEQDLQLSLRGRHGLQLHEARDLRADQRAQGRSWATRRSICRKAWPVKISLHEGVPIAIELPQRVTFEIVEADPVVKGQTASSSYKPAMLSNGARVMVPPHIGAARAS